MNSLFTMLRENTEDGGHACIEGFYWSCVADWPKHGLNIVCAPVRNSLTRNSCKKKKTKNGMNLAQIKQQHMVVSRWNLSSAASVICLFFFCPNLLISILAVVFDVNQPVVSPLLLPILSTHRVWDLMSVPPLPPSSILQLSPSSKVFYSPHLSHSALPPPPAPAPTSPTHFSCATHWPPRREPRISFTVWPGGHFSV